MTVRVGPQNVKGDGVLLLNVDVRLLAQLDAVLEMELDPSGLVLGWVDGQVRLSPPAIVPKPVADICSTQGCHLQVRINQMVSQPQTLWAPPNKNTPTIRTTTWSVGDDACGESITTGWS